MCCISGATVSFSCGISDRISVSTRISAGISAGNSAGIRAGISAGVSTGVSTGVSAGMRGGKGFRLDSQSVEQVGAQRLEDHAEVGGHRGIVARRQHLCGKG